MATPRVIYVWMEVKGAWRKVPMTFPYGTGTRREWEKAYREQMLITKRHRELCKKLGVTPKKGHE